MIFDQGFRFILSSLLLLDSRQLSHWFLVYMILLHSLAGFSAYHLRFLLDLEFISYVMFYGGCGLR